MEKHFSTSTLGSLIFLISPTINKKTDHIYWCQNYRRILLLFFQKSYLKSTNKCVAIILAIQDDLQVVFLLPSFVGHPVPLSIIGVYWRKVFEGANKFWRCLNMFNYYIHFYLLKAWKLKGRKEVRSWRYPPPLPFCEYNKNV